MTTKAHQLLDRYENLGQVRDDVVDHLKTELRKPTVLLGIGAALGVQFLDNPYFIQMASVAALDGVRNYFMMHPDEFEVVADKVKSGGVSALNHMPSKVQQLVLLMVKAKHSGGAER